MRRFLWGCEAGLLAAILALAAGCGSRETGGSAPASLATTGPGAADASAPTLDEMANASYRGVEMAGGQVKLAGGRWEGPAPEGGAARPEVSLVKGLRAEGDLDGDGRKETAALLSATSGGSGTFTYLVVTGRRNGKVVDLGTAPLGDRVQVRGMKIRDGRIFVDLVQPGPEDAACCPGELATRGWALQREGPGEELTEFVSTTKRGRLSLETLSGKRWVLRGWDLETPAPSKPEVTLEVGEGSLQGSSGCNRYSASATEGPSAGDLALGPLAVTRKGCPEPVMAVEARYLGLLGSVKKFGFLAGKLALSYEKDSAVGVLLFEASPQPGS